LYKKLFIFFFFLGRVRVGFAPSDPKRMTVEPTFCGFSANCWRILRRESGRALYFSGGVFNY
jgi:hypothetical protein